MEEGDTAGQASHAETVRHRAAGPGQPWPEPRHPRGMAGAEGGRLGAEPVREPRALRGLQLCPCTSSPVSGVASWRTGMDRARRSSASPLPSPLPPFRPRRGSRGAWPFSTRAPVPGEPAATAAARSRSSVPRHRPGLLRSSCLLCDVSYLLLASRFQGDELFPFPELVEKSSCTFFFCC